MIRRINDQDLEQLVSQGLGVTAIARALSCSKGAVSKRLKKMNVVTKTNLTLYQPDPGKRPEMSMIDQFIRINKEAMNLLDKLLETPEKSGARLRDPRDLAIRLMAELRQHVELWHELEKTRFNVEVVREFMGELVTFLAEECGDEARRRFIDRVNQRKSLQRIFEHPRLLISELERSEKYS